MSDLRRRLEQADDALPAIAGNVIPGRGPSDSDLATELTRLSTSHGHGLEVRVLAEQDRIIGDALVRRAREAGA